MAWKLLQEWESAEYDNLKVEETKTSGRRLFLRYRVANTANNTYISLTPWELMELAELLGEVCDEIEEREEKDDPQADSHEEEHP